MGCAQLSSLALIGPASSLARIICAGSDQKSFFVVLNAKDLSEVARAALPVAVPFGFHGNDPSLTESVTIKHRRWGTIAIAESAAMPSWRPVHKADVSRL